VHASPLPFILSYASLWAAPQALFHFVLPSSLGKYLIVQAWEKSGRSFLWEGAGGSFFFKRKTLPQYFTSSPRLDFFLAEAYNGSGEEREKNLISPPKRERVIGCKRAWQAQAVPPGAAELKKE